MQAGLYEQVVSLVLERQLESLHSETVCLERLDQADSHDYLAQYVCRILAQGLAQVRSLPGLKSETERASSRLQRQISLCNEIIEALQQVGIEGLEGDKVSEEAHRLLEILVKASSIKSPQVRPDTPLSLGALLTGTRQDPSLVSQLHKEIVTADRVDILCSFIKWSGIRILEAALRILTAQAHKRLRVIATSYMGATDLKAIRMLASLPNTEVKISYDAHRTRLHAKAYLIYRNTGFSSAYVGSANISHAALTDGLEWNVKISQYEQAFQWEKISATFETYWNDKEFETYAESRDEQRLSIALAKERQSVPSEEFVLPNFDLRPYAFQQEILDRIAAERQLQDRGKHLVVAATGTGKTMIAAFDYKAWGAWKRESGLNREPRFLFVAHREEILKQSLYTFRAVLRNQNFGDLMVGGRRPEQIDQLFISIQTYNSQNLSDILAKEHYEYVVIDEFHHAAAPSYQDLLSHIAPESLLGLTATPERADGLNIKQHFDDHITAEIRLPDAINRKLLCPFQYFGITDSVDYSGLRWQRGGYAQADLENVLTGNDVRASLVIEKTVATVLNIQKVRALGFCVSQAHAEYMARKFNEADIAADYLTAKSDHKHRQTIQRRLVDREINIIFVVDLYNEGVDIPNVDTVLFLRPTESLTVFLQQLGRGLRLADNKDCLTVLDFVGQSHQRYRFDIRLGSLLSKKSYRVADELEQNFPHLPAGCFIHFEKQARQYVLENIKQALLKSKPRIIQNIASFTAETGLILTLRNFLDYYYLSLDDIYRRASWSRLCVEAGVREGFTEPDEARLAKGLRRLQHINDIAHIDRLQCLLDTSGDDLASLSELDQRRLLMLHFTLWGQKQAPGSLAQSLAQLQRNPVLQAEVKALLALKRDSVASVTPAQTSLPVCPLKVHAQYTRDEILAGLGYWTLKSQPSMREGVLHLPGLPADAFFITLNKAEKHYSPTTMYEDYAISDTLFHWQSQSRTTEESDTGQRYIQHKRRNHLILLFVREERNNRANLAEPYHFLGSSDYVSHTGSRPMSITWQLHYPIPAHLLKQTSRLAVG